MARLFNGTSDKLTATLDLSGASIVTVALWNWWDSFTPLNGAGMLNYGDIDHSSSFLVQPQNNTPAAPFGIAMAVNITGTQHYWFDSFATPSAAAWHHYCFVFDRATPQLTYYLDGAVQTPVQNFREAVTYGNFANDALTLMQEPHTSLSFGAGRCADVGLWTVGLSSSDAAALARGASPPSVHPSNLLAYWRLVGSDSPEPDSTVTNADLTLTGTSYTADPAALAGIASKNQDFSQFPNPALRR